MRDLIISLSVPYPTGDAALRGRPMIHRFDRLEIDENTREVRVGGQVVLLQPRVFDLVVYLARNSERVVPKDELLDSVWPGVIVTDASLQRAVSLARSALAHAGVSPSTIRTHARQGYRLCAEPVVDPPSVEPAAAPAEPAGANQQNGALQRAHAAYARGDWEAAIAELRQVDNVEGLTAADLQLWAHAAQCAGRPHDAVQPLERAVAAYSARGDRRRAAWVAILLAQLRVEFREPVLARGWYHRASRLLEHEPPCRERGYLDLLGARMALLQNELEACLQLGESARQTGERLGDRDLESLGLVHVGEARLYLGKIREGLAALDEAGVSVVASDLSPWAGGLVYCGVIYSCMTRADWLRAGQWTDQFTRWSADKGVAGYPGLCRMHRAEVLAVRGEIREAESEIRATIAMLARQAPWAEGDAWDVLGEILLARGALDEAREAFVRATELGWESQFGLALVRFAAGDVEGAANLLARTLAENAWSARSKRGQALAHYAIITAAAGQPEKGRAALAELDQERDLASTPALQALRMRAGGEVLAAEGNRAGALVQLRLALRAWLALEAPLAAAQTRCRIADLLHADGDSEAAAVELDAARTAFQQAGADGLLRQCATFKAALSARRVASPRETSRVPRPVSRP